MRRCFLLVVLALPCALPVHAAAPATPENQAAARAAYAEARGLFSSDLPASIARLRQATELDPDNLEIHDYYIRYARYAVLDAGKNEAERHAGDVRITGELAAHYEALAAREPDRAAFQYALGAVFLYADPDRSRGHFEAALKLAPGSAKILGVLALHAAIRGDAVAELDFRRRAIAAQPDEPDNWRMLVASLASTDVDQAVATALQMGARFPEEAAGILSYLAGRQEEAAARKLFELVLEKFPTAKSANLTGLFSLRLRESPARALALAQNRLAVQPQDPLWTQLAAYAQALIDADAALAAAKPAEALAVLQKVKLPRYGADRRWLDLALARATAAGPDGPAKAYADLLETFAKTPTDDTQAALVHYGATLGKTAATVTAEVAEKRAAAAQPGIPFSLVEIATGKTVSLDDYRGRVVLVNFWYPLCGPCRGEFPFLQQVLAKYRDRGFALLAINGHRTEEHLVAGLLRGAHLEFTALRGDDATIDAYNVDGYPSNFLYGPDGRIHQRPPTIGSVAARRAFELQIEALLPPPKT